MGEKDLEVGGWLDHTYKNLFQKGFIKIYFNIYCICARLISRVTLCLDNRLDNRLKYSNINKSINQWIDQLLKKLNEMSTQIFIDQLNQSNITYTNNFNCKKPHYEIKTKLTTSNLPLFCCAQLTQMKSQELRSILIILLLRSNILSKHMFHNYFYSILLIPCMSSSLIWRNKNSQLHSAITFMHFYQSLR